MFDRRRAGHPWFGAFGELEAQGGTTALVCANWRMDHRVAEEREEALLAAPEFAGEPSGSKWWAARHAHFLNTFAQPPNLGAGLPSAYRELANQANSLAGRGLPTGQHLIHVASLNRILKRLSTGLYATGDLKLRYRELTGHTWPTRSLGSRVDSGADLRRVDRVAEDLNGKGPDAVKRFAQLVCDAFGEAQPPWWACFAAEVAPLVARGDGAGLCRALGMGHLGQGEWLLVWRYELRLLQRLHLTLPLYRPTVVEADESPFHYPSPPGVAVGVTMPLASGMRALREVVHPPLVGETAAVACTGNLLRIEKSPFADHNHLPGLRRAHRQRLLAQYRNPVTKEWLDRHPDLP